MRTTAPPPATRPRRRLRRFCGPFAIAAVVGVVFSACSATTHAPTAAHERDYPWRLRPPSAFAGDFLWRQQLLARFGMRKLGFQAVVQKQADKLTLIGLGPAGSKAFVLSQTGEQVTFRSHMPRKMPFPPRFILIDIQRAWLKLSPEATRPDGTHTIDLGDETLQETWRGGRLVRRSFVRKDGKPKGQILVTYEASTALNPTAAGAKPGVVVLSNGWFGYELRIETLEARPL